MFNLNSKKLLASTATLAVALGTVAIAPQSAKAGTFSNTWDNNKSYCTDLNLGKSCSLQNLLDSVTVGGPGVDTVNDQTGYDLFTNTATGVMPGSFMFELGDYAPDNVFGIYNSKGDKVELFSGSSTAGDTAVHIFEEDDDFGNIFGFYMTNKRGQTFYTENSRNQGGFQQAVVYQGDNETIMDLPGKAPGTFTDSEFIIAFEDLWLGGPTDYDYNDMVVMVGLVEPVESVPEPATMAGLGLVGAAMALSRRRKNKKNS